MSSPTTWILAQLICTSVRIFRATENLTHHTNKSHIVKVLWNLRSQMSYQHLITTCSGTICARSHVEKLSGSHIEAYAVGNINSVNATFQQHGKHTCMAHHQRLHGLKSTRSHKCAHKLLPNCISNEFADNSQCTSLQK